MKGSFQVTWEKAIVQERRSLRSVVRSVRLPLLQQPDESI